MAGQFLNLFFLLGLGLIAQACGKGASVTGAPSFILGQITDPGTGQEFSVSRQATRTWQDYDGDGFSDRLDPDIDDDGIPNLADQYPFDGSQYGTDSDRDGIADFIDLARSGDPERRRLAPLQKQIFQQLRITVILGGENFSQDEWRELHRTLLSQALRARLNYSQLAVIVRYPESERKGETRADYDSLWKQISFFPNDNHRGNPRAFNGSLVHELGHVHAAENPTEFAVFAMSFDGFVSPSRYGASSAEEAYAENFLYQLVQRREVVVDMRRFDNL